MAATLLLLCKSPHCSLAAYVLCLLIQVLHQVAQKHNISVANVALKWVMQQGDGKTVFPIVGLRSTAHIADNLRVLQLQLDTPDLEAVNEVLQRAQGPKGDIYSFERGM